MCCIVVFNFFLFCLSMDCLCLTQINNNNNNNNNIKLLASIISFEQVMFYMNT